MVERSIKNRTIFNKHSAIKLFVQVSIDFPASVTTQAAAIAKKILGEQNPDLAFQTFKELLDDQQSLGVITKAANITHRQKDVRSTTTDEVVQIRKNDVKAVLRKEIPKIERFLDNPETIEEIIANYPEIKRQDLFAGF